MPKITSVELLYSIIFTALNLVGVYLIVNKFDWILMAFVMFVILSGFYIIFANLINEIDLHFNEKIPDIAHRFFLSTTIIASLFIAYTDTLIPGGANIKKYIEYMPIFIPAIIIIAIAIVLERDYKFKKVVDDLNNLHDD